MNPSSLSLNPPLEPPQVAALPVSPVRSRRARLAVAVAAAGLVATLVVVGDPWTMLLVAGAAAAAAWAGFEHRRAHSGLRTAPDMAPAALDASPAREDEDSAPGAAAGAKHHGAEIMLTQIVPVWERQVFAARDAADLGLSRLLEVFSGVSGAVDELSSRMASVAGGGALDAQRLDEHPALQALQATGARAFAERDAAIALIGRVAEGLAQLQQSAKGVRELSRHARLVAFNASIEAQRGSGAGEATGGRNGASAVAEEVRMLSTRLAEAAEQVDQLASGLLRESATAHREGAIHATGEDELRIELQVRAREVLAALGGELGSALAGSGVLQQVSEQLSAQVAEAFTHFQFGDRLSQMLAILGNDMNQLVRWVQRHPVATRQDAAEWLEALEASYTMEEQRAQHHGNVHVERSSGVDFF